MNKNESEGNPKIYRDSSLYLTRLYVIALSFIALLAIFGQILIQHALQNQQEDAYKINVAGRQRMLSQKICKLSLLIEASTEDKEREKYISDLKATAATWETFHKGLSHGNKQLQLVEQNSITVKELFGNLDPYFYNMLTSVKNIIAYKKPSAVTSQVKTILLNEDDFLNRMDKIVLQYQIEAREEVSFTKHVEIILLTLTLFILMLEGVFIFKPSAKQIRSTIKQLKEAQSQLTQTNTELEERVRKRTEEVYKKNQELKLKNEELYKKNNDLDTFVYAASHDLKAPINNIEGLTNQLSSQISESEKAQIIEMISESIQKFKHVIKDLAETGKEKAEIENTKIEFKEILNEIVFSIHDLILKSQAKIYEDFSDASYIYFSKKNTRSILYNLISNAIKYCPPERTPVIKIRTKMINGYTLLEVSDNARGIREEEKQKVFSMYQRLDTNPEGHGSGIEGTGVGMAIVAKIVDGNGGKIEIESTPGKGSIFRVYLKISPLTPIL